MGRSQCLRESVGAAAPGVRRARRNRLDLAGRRRMHRQGPAGKKGAAGEAEATGRNPTDRGKSGTKRHLLTDGRGLPLAIVLTGANRHDMKMLESLLDGHVLARPE